MDAHGRRKLVAGILVGALIVLGLIVEAMHDKTIRKDLGFLGMIVAGIVALLALAVAWFAS